MWDEQIDLNKAPRKLEKMVAISEVVENLDKFLIENKGYMLEFWLIKYKLSVIYLYGRQRQFW